MDYDKYEDIVFKKAMEIFQQSSAPIFNIDTKLNKFEDLGSKRFLKEKLSLTEIGHMIRDEGISEGIVKGKSQLVIKQLINKFKKIPNNYVENIRNLSDDTLDVIATHIFDMDKVEDLEKYF